MIPEILWLIHAAILINHSGKTVAVDPWKIKSNYRAELVLVTHSHFDHCSPDDISKILKENGTVIAPPDALAEIKADDKRTIAPGEKINLGWVIVEAVPAYNLKAEFHPRNKNWVGYILRYPDTSVYIAGDTDFIPEMENIKTDVAIVPVGGKYTMSAESAADAVNIMKPKLAIPIHYGDIVGTEADAKRFAELVTESEARILKQLQ